MPVMVRTLLATAVALIAAAPLQAQSRNDILTWEEIDRLKGKGGTAFDAVESLRPRWLRIRESSLVSGAIRSEGARVYMRGVDQGGVDYLRTIPAENVYELRWLSGNEASSRFGPTTGPAIVVTLKI